MQVKHKKHILGICRFIEHIDKPIEQVMEEDVRTYLVYLIEELNRSAIYVNQAVSAISFCYRTILRRPFGFDIPRRERR